jgi:single-strand DNA-binding protein
MSSLNKAMLIGRVGKQPEVKTFGNGNKVANFSIATSERWKDKSGERKEKTHWHNIAVFNENLIKVIESYVQKGDLIYLEGQIQTRDWEVDGVKKYTTEIVLDRFNGVLVMLGGKGESGGDTVTSDAPIVDEDYSQSIPF